MCICSCVGYIGVCACGGQRSTLGIVPQDVHLVLETGSLTGTLGRHQGSSVSASPRQALQFTWALGSERNLCTDLLVSKLFMLAC